MTPAATPEALVESLRKSLAMAVNDPGHVVRADGTKAGYKGDRCIGGWIADAILAGPLAPVLADLQRVTAERDGWKSTLRYCERQWQDERGAMLDRLATATAEAASLRAEVAQKDRVLQQVKSWIDTDLPAGTSRAGTIHRVVSKALDPTALARAATAGEG